MSRDWKFLCDLIELFEGFKSKPYLDSVDLPTIGIGSTRYPDGRKVSMADAPIMREQAQGMLVYHLEQKVWPAVSTISDLNRWQLTAILSFIYNVGSGAFARSTMKKRILSGDMEAAAQEFPKWRKAGKKVVQGLVNRRRVEQAVFRGECNSIPKAKILFI